MQTTEYDQNSSMPSFIFMCEVSNGLKTSLKILKILMREPRLSLIVLALDWLRNGFIPCFEEK